MAQTDRRPNANDGVVSIADSKAKLKTLSLHKLNLSPKSERLLMGAGINTVGALLECTSRDLWNICGQLHDALIEIYMRLDKLRTEHVVAVAPVKGIREKIHAPSQPLTPSDSSRFIDWTTPHNAPFLSVTLPASLRTKPITSMSLPPQIMGALQQSGVATIGALSRVTNSRYARICDLYGINLSSLKKRVLEIFTYCQSSTPIIAQSLPHELEQTPLNQFVRPDLAAYEKLRSNGIDTLGQVAQKSRAELLAVGGMTQGELQKLITIVHEVTGHSACVEAFTDNPQSVEDIAPRTTEPVKTSLPNSVNVAPTTPHEKPVEVAKNKAEPLLGMSPFPAELRELPLTVLQLRPVVIHRLKLAGVPTVGDIANLREADLCTIEGISARYARIIAKRFRHFLSTRRSIPNVAYVPLAEDSKTPAADPMPSLPMHMANEAVSVLQLSRLPRNCLKRVGIRTLGELSLWTRDALLAINNMGTGSVDEVMRRFSDHVHDNAPALSNDKPLLLAHVAQQPVSVLDLSTRSRNCLHVAGIRTIGELSHCTRGSLLSIRHMGIGSVDEVMRRLSDYVNDNAPISVNETRGRATALRPSPCTPFPWDERSILGRAVDELLPGEFDDQSSELELVKELSLSEQSMRRLRALGITADDEMSTIGCSTFGYIAQVLRGCDLTELLTRWSEHDGLDEGVLLTALESEDVGVLSSQAEEAITPYPALLNRTFGYWDVEPDKVNALASAGFHCLNDIKELREYVFLSRFADIGEGICVLRNLHLMVEQQVAMIEASTHGDFWQHGSLREAFLSLIEYACNSREGSIWVQRYGLDGNEPKTLEQVAQVFRITRERVRQIVMKAEQKISKRVRAAPKHRGGASITAPISRAFEQCMGRATVEDFAGMLRACVGWTETPGRVELKALSGILQHGEHRTAACEFSMDRLSGGARGVIACNACEVFHIRVKAAVSIVLEDMVADMHIADFAYDVGRHLWTTECPNVENCPLETRQCLRWADTKTLPLAYLRVVLLEKWAKRLSGDTVLSPVRAAAERGTTIPEAARGALEMLGKPAHYSEIAECVRKNNPRYAQTSDQGVLQRLLDMDWFVITDVGTYGLREWNVKKHQSVANRIEALLRAHGRPMAVRDVVERLVKHGTKEGTVLANLDKGRFMRPSYGMIWLNEEVTESPKNRIRIVLQGKTFEANLDRKAVLIKCQPGDELFQELAEYAYSRGVLPDVWEWNAAGELRPEPDRYKDETSWLNACRRHVESGLFKIAEEDGLLVPQLEAELEGDNSVLENTIEEEEVGSLFDLDDDDDVILF